MLDTIEPKEMKEKSFGLWGYLWIIHCFVSAFSLGNIFYFVSYLGAANGIILRKKYGLYLTYILLTIVLIKTMLGIIIDPSILGFILIFISSLYVGYFYERRYLFK